MNTHGGEESPLKITLMAPLALPTELMSLLAIQVGQRKCSVQSQANWVFALEPVRGSNRSEKEPERCYSWLGSCFHAASLGSVPGTPDGPLGP